MVAATSSANFTVADARIDVALDTPAPLNRARLAGSFASQYRIVAGAWQMYRRREGYPIGT